MPAKLSPVPPGEILLEEFLKPLGLSQNRLARELRRRAGAGERHHPCPPLGHRRFRGPAGSVLRHVPGFLAQPPGALRRQTRPAPIRPGICETDYAARRICGVALGTLSNPSPASPLPSRDRRTGQGTAGRRRRRSGARRTSRGQGSSLPIALWGCGRLALSHIVNGGTDLCHVEHCNVRAGSAKGQAAAGRLVNFFPRRDEGGRSGARGASQWLVLTQMRLGMLPPLPAQASGAP